MFSVGSKATWLGLQKDNYFGKNKYASSTATYLKDNFDIKLHKQRKLWFLGWRSCV